MEVFAILISLAALFFSWLTYFKHDKKIKQQSTLLNKYHLEKIEKEKEADKRAIIEANVISEANGNKKIKIYNRGKCIARDVNVIIPKSEEFYVFSNPCPIDIRPRNGIEIELGAFSNNCPDTIEVYFEWNDDFKVKNKDNQKIQLF